MEHKTFYEDGSIQTIEHFFGNQLSNQKGPALVEYYDKMNGETVKCHKFYMSGKLHRDDDKPAVIAYYSKFFGGKVEYEEYWIDGELFRKNKPAVIHYNTKGDITSMLYF